MHLVKYAGCGRMIFISNIGAATIRRTRSLFFQAGFCAAALRLMFSPGTWTVPVRNVFARQILFTAVEATRFALMTGLIIGVSIGAQLQVWLNRAGQSDLLAPALVAILLREAGPLITNLILIGRSGTAIASEIATMRVNGETHLLDAQGIEPMRYLVVPRALGMMVSVFSLTVLFTAATLLAGYAMSALLGATTQRPMAFFGALARAVELRDVFNLLAKTLIPGFLTATLCCASGLAIRGAATEIPQATTRGLTRSIIALLFTSAVVSVLTYA